jgi:hypothetical protein
MDHRNYSNDKTCQSCRYWSEMIAKAEGNGVEAYCLNRESPKSQTYTFGHNTCEKWVDGPYGAIDEPGGGDLYLLNFNPVNGVPVPGPLTLVEKAEQILNDWLVDRTEDLFEEEPEIDEARLLLVEAIRQLKNSPQSLSNVSTQPHPSA